MEKSVATLEWNSAKCRSTYVLNVLYCSSWLKKRPRFVTLCTFEKCIVTQHLSDVTRKIAVVISPFQKSTKPVDCKRGRSIVLSVHWKCINPKSMKVSMNTLPTALRFDIDSVHTSYAFYLNSSLFNNLTYRAPMFAKSPLWTLLAAESSIDTRAYLSFASKPFIPRSGHPLVWSGDNSRLRVATIEKGRVEGSIAFSRSLDYCDRSWFGGLENFADDFPLWTHLFVKCTPVNFLPG